MILSEVKHNQSIKLNLSIMAAVILLTACGGSDRDF